VPQQTAVIRKVGTLEDRIVKKGPENVIWRSGCDWLLDVSACRWRL